MTGVVLCGGKSSRMGSDKALLRRQSETWAHLASNKLSDLKLPVVLSVNAEQYHSYKLKFEDLEIVADHGSLDVYGPAKGILSVHTLYTREDLLVLACDMPGMQKEVIAHLIKTSAGKNEDAFVFKNDTFVEPLCAIYTSKGLKKIYERYNQGELKKNSLHHILENISTFFLPVPLHWKGYFKNYNSPDDLNDL